MVRLGNVLSLSCSLCLAFSLSPTFMFVSITVKLRVSLINRRGSDQRRTAATCSITSSPPLHLRRTETPPPSPCCSLEMPPPPAMTWQRHKQSRRLVNYVKKEEEKEEESVAWEKSKGWKDPLKAAAEVSSFSRLNDDVGSKSHQTGTFFLLFLSFRCFFWACDFFWLWLDLYFLTATKIIAKVMRHRRSPFKEQRDDENDGEQRRHGFKGNCELTVLTAPLPLVRQ